MIAPVSAPPRLEDRIRAQAYGLGFDLVGIAALGPAETARHFEAWLSLGYAGDMHYLPRWAEKRRDTRLPFADVSSAIVVAMNYGGTQPPGSIARYARGDDYHDVMTERLQELHRWISAETGSNVRGKAYVDTGPILERDLARRAGLGWFGKNTNLINPELGSFFFLGALLVDLELAADEPFEVDRCGTCTRCLEACPTQALVDDRVLDATKCISYLTIEHRGAIPHELRESLGGLVYGCDICQDVCPWNVRFSRELTESRLAPRVENIAPDPRELLALDDEGFRRRFKGSPIKRAKRRGLARNAAVALGNRRDPHDVSALTAALDDAEPIVRQHAAWALGRIGSNDARVALGARREIETEPTVLEELDAALGDRR
ncbi:MAG TPA: tRNA epoxyqueuosine(34) reductase QueG [Gemmatimonadaceae bacterium]|nr:tRNA epoxyqueuosine(34) reductase QueG [Gemmatimonadaceae bacterium]